MRRGLTGRGQQEGSTFATIADNSVGRGGGPEKGGHD